MLVDTSGLLCCFDSGDGRHVEAVKLFRQADARITHNYVLAEFVALCHARRHDPAKSLAFLADLTDHPAVEVVWVSESLHRAAVSLLASRLDIRYSLADAVSFVVMRDRALSVARTTDRHFSQEGFDRLLDP